LSCTPTIFTHLLAPVSIYSSGEVEALRISIGREEDEGNGK